MCVKCNLFQTIHSLLFISHRNTLGTALLGSVGTITITALEQRQTVGAIADIPFEQRQSVGAIDTTEKQVAIADIFKSAAIKWRRFNFIRAAT